MLKEMYEDLLGLKLVALFLIYAAVSLLLMFLYNHEVWNDNLYLSNFDGNTQEAQQRIANIRRLDNIRYMSMPILFIFKILLIYSILYIGILFNKLNFNKLDLLKCLIISEFIFLLQKAIEVIWFIFFNNNASRKDIDSFSFLGVINLINDENVKTKFLYPLKLVNLYEVLYMLVLSFGFGIITNDSIAKSFKLVTSTYGLSLILYVLILFYIAL